MIAITFALPAESSNLIALVREKKVDKNKIVCGKIDNRNVAILHTGVGRKSCERKIDSFFSEVRPDVLVSAGFAGGVGDDLNVGDLILAENFSDAALLSRVRQRLEGNTRTGNLLTSTSVVDSISERNEAARASGADAVDMETEVIAQACGTRSIPLLSLRVISDSVREPLPAPPHILFDIERQRTPATKVIAHFLTNPKRIRSLMHFAKRIAEARARLTDAIVTVVRELAG